MLALWAGISTMSAYDAIVSGIYYNFSGTEAIVTYKDANPSYSGSVSIPSTVTYRGVSRSVTSIGMSAFKDCRGLTSVTIPNSVTSIGESAFSGCYGLKSITIPNSVTSIGEAAFGNCSELTSITIPNSVTSIGDYAFQVCTGLTSVTISESVTSIGQSTFTVCSSLTSVTIPNSVTSIGKSAFNGCSSLTSITIPNSVTTIGNSAFSSCSGLTSVTIGNSVTSIGYSAFGGCSGLTSITIPNSVTSIGESAFGSCSSLTSITIPNSVTSIGESAFGSCSDLTSIIVNENNAVYDSRNNCNAIIKTATNTLVSGCKTTVIPNSVTSIGNYAFGGCSGLTSITIPNSVTSIGDRAFRNCSGLTSVTIPNSVTSIGRYAFEGCSGLTSVTIPNSVTSIGNYAFSYCSGLTSVVSLIREPFPFGTSAFSSIAANCVLKVPAGKRETYIAQGWTENIFRGGVVEMPLQEITLVDGTAFENDEDKFYDEITYTRSFGNTNWQSLYVPFEIPVTAQLLEEFEFAYINGAKQYDDNNDGVPDRLTIESFKVKSGTLRANNPYIIRAKTTGEKTITINEATLYATAANSIDCSTTTLLFTFQGSYSKLNYEDMVDCYLLGGGTWNPTASGNTMKPMRFYMKVTSRGNNQVISSAPSIRLQVDGETTDIEASPISSPVGTDMIFDLQGRPVENPENGIYIINGKKTVVR